MQMGVVRTNCMDCLDRTNVVQSMFARRQLHEQLARLGLTSQLNFGKTAFERFAIDGLEPVFRCAWTSNSNQLSVQYTGTPGLKTEITRTGKLSLVGILADSRISLARYVINNFYDGYNHDCLDVASGHLTPLNT